MAKLDPQDIRKELSVGEVARRSGLPVSTIHFYEAQGLISSRRSSGNQRRFSRATLRIVAIIKVAQKTGIALAAIREALSRLPADHKATAADWKMLSEDWKTDLDARITRLTRLRDHSQTASAAGACRSRIVPCVIPWTSFRHWARGRGCSIPIDRRLRPFGKDSLDLNNS
jgi:MerR family redox-sensitive transcriptional activator SoxR